MHSGRYTFLVIAVFLVLLLVFGAGCTGTKAPTSTVQNSSPSAPVIGSNTPASHQVFVEPEDDRSVVLATIAGAQKTITLTIYQLDDTEIVDALIAAQNRGVSVRVIYNNASFAAANQTNPNLGAVANLTKAGVQTKPASPVFAITHQKTLTADGKRSVVMTFNLDPMFFGSTRDFGIVTTNASEVREIEDVFEADWNFRNITPTYPTLVWSPVNSREKIIGVINHANKTLEVYNDEINDPECINALVAAAKRGVAVRVLAADMNAANGSNENAPALATLNAGGAQAKTITSLYIHAKVVIADYGTPQQVASVGSEYMAPVSLDQSRELAILVSEKPILDRIESTFNSDWLVPAMPES